MSAPWGREGASSNVEKSGQGNGGGSAVSGHSIQKVSVREKRALKGRFIIIFLC